MEKSSFAEELYSGSLRISHGGPDDPNPTANVDLQDEDGSLWYCSDGELENASDRDREWQKRCEHHHTVGYHDGLMAGIDASSQEGFNIGFKESVPVGYNWGIVRGVTSALACLPNDLKERLMETKERRDQFQGLYESVHLVSTTDALQLFHAEKKKKESAVQSNHAKAISNAGDLENNCSNRGRLENYIGELESLLLEHPTIKSQLSLK